jgi:hypothetical protein
MLGLVMKNISLIEIVLAFLVSVVTFILTIAAPFFTIFTLNIVGAGVEYSFANIAALYVLGGITGGFRAMTKALSQFYKP